MSQHFAARTYFEQARSFACPGGIILCMGWFTVVFLVALALQLGVETWLRVRQRRSVLAHRDSVPGAFADRISLEDHHKAADYTLANLRASHVGMVVGAAVLLWLTLGGGISWFDAHLRRVFPASPMWIGLGVIFAVFGIKFAVNLPMSIYQTFVIEQRFGFNKTTVGTFIADLIKGVILLGILGGALAFGALWLMRSAGDAWWVWVWVMWSAFMLFIMWAFPRFIAPLFNKFQPLRDEDLRARLEQLLARCGFKSDGLFVMDGSRRSSHGNAFFSGFGRNKRIVFFDTLLEQLDGDEVEAVLAHELGHFKKKHIARRMVLMIAMGLIGAAVLGWLAGQPWFYGHLGVDIVSNHAALILFMEVTPAFTMLLAPVMNFLSRKDEFEADDFAAEQSDARALISGLVKMYKENAMTLTPDPMYSLWHHSHPPARERVGHLQEAASGKPA